MNTRSCLLAATSLVLFFSLCLASADKVSAITFPPPDGTPPPESPIEDPIGPPADPDPYPPTGPGPDTPLDPPQEPDGPTNPDTPPGQPVF